MRLTSQSILNGILAVAVLSTTATFVNAADEKVFSGPQAGEKLPALKVTGIFGEDAGKNSDYTKRADGKPTVLIFMHKLTRPGAAVERMIMTFCGKKKRDKFFAGVVYLSDDVTAATQRLKRAQRALVPNKNMYFGVSADGAEGPGAYGLNRKMTLTILVADKGKVTANFALVQPGPQTDVLKVLKAVVKITGDKMPTLASLGVRGSQDPNLRGYLGPIIQKDATAKEVDAAVEKLEAYLKKYPRSRAQVGDIARRIVNSGKLDNYGTKHAQEHIKRWAKEFKARKRNRKRKKKQS